MNTESPGPSQPDETASYRKIVEAATRVYGAHGTEAATYRRVADAAGVSTGLVQHYFKNKDALTEAVDKYVVDKLHAHVPLEPLTADPYDALATMGERLTALFVQSPDEIDYIARSLLEGGDTGKIIFDGMFALSQAQGQMFAEMGQTREDLDPLWGTLHPLILRIGSMMLRHHIDRHLPAPFTTADQLERWDQAVTALIRHGQMKG